MTSTADQVLVGERADLAQTLAKHRGFLRFTTRDLTDEQAARPATVSALTLGGLVKHVTSVERQWVRFIRQGPSAMGDFNERTDSEAVQQYLDGFRMLPGETLPGLLADYEAAASETDELLAALPDLNATQPLPEAPWYEPAASWSAGRPAIGCADG